MEEEEVPERSATTSSVDPFPTESADRDTPGDGDYAANFQSPQDAARNDLSRQFLKRIGRTALYISRTPRPLELAVDAFVVPTNPRGTGGKIVEQMASAGWDWYAVIQDLPREDPEVLVKPEAPIFIPSQATQGPAILIAATAASPAHSDLALGANVAARAIVAGAAARNVHRLAMPILGTGIDGTDVPAIVRCIVAGINSALPQPVLREITLLTVSEDAYKETLALFDSVPQRFVNDTARGDDLLDVAAEVQALTDILLLRDLEPPMAVGVLGGWGTGKSFVLHLMRKHIELIRSQPATGAWSEEGGPGQYVGHIYPITFDAWTYAKTNLWASLMQTIFTELSRQMLLEERLKKHLHDDSDPEAEGRLWLKFQEFSDRDRRMFFDSDGWMTQYLELADADAAAGGALWKALGGWRDEQQRTLHAKEKAAAQVAVEIEEKRAEVTKGADDDTQKRVFAEVWEGVKNDSEILDIVRSTVSADPGAAAVERFVSLTSRDVRQLSVSLESLFAVAKRRPGLTAAVAAVVLTTMAAGAVLWFKEVWFAGVVAWVASFAAAGTAALEGAQVWRRRVVEAMALISKRVGETQKQFEKRREATVRQSVAGNDGIKRLENQQRQLQAEIAGLRQQIGFTADYLSVGELVAARIQKAEYAGELGLMNLVQRDIDELTAALTLPIGHPKYEDLKKHFPRGPARVVLFIDDLDRCPPQRVVEVLEAVQLLVKTKLFVVVLALDVRYVTRALEKVYQGILVRHGNPSGLDYIEKIIQLPYSVRPIDSTNVDRYLRGQVVVEARKRNGGTATGAGAPGAVGAAPAGAAQGPADAVLEAKTLVFTEEEVGHLGEYCSRVGLSPRAIKRVVNAYKLLKIVWARPNRHTPPSGEIKDSVVALLVLSAAYPNAMREIFPELLQQVGDANAAPVKLQEAMAALATGLTGDVPSSEAEDIVERLTIIPAAAKLTSKTRPTLELVRALSFVAELGYDAAESATNGGRPHRPAAPAA